MTTISLKLSFLPSISANVSPIEFDWLKTSFCPSKASLRGSNGGFKEGKWKLCGPWSWLIHDHFRLKDLFVGLEEPSYYISASNSSVVRSQLRGAWSPWFSRSPIVQYCEMPEQARLRGVAKSCQTHVSPWGRAFLAYSGCCQCQVMRSCPSSWISRKFCSHHPNPSTSIYLCICTWLGALTLFLWYKNSPCRFLQNTSQQFHWSCP